MRRSDGAVEAIARRAPWILRGVGRLAPASALAVGPRALGRDKSKGAKHPGQARAAARASSAGGLRLRRWMRVSEPGLNDPFEEAIDDALSALPADLRAAMSNVEIVVEDEPPDGRPLLGLYRGVPLPRRSSNVQRSASRQDQQSSAGRSRDSLPATPIVCAARSDTSCSTRSRITSGSATSG